MRKGVLAIIIASLILGTIFAACSTAKADGIVVIRGRVTYNGIGVIGATVEASGGASVAYDKTGPMGFYTVPLSLKRTPTSVTVTIYSKVEEPTSKTIEHVSGGNYWLAFHLGAIGDDIPVSNPLTRTIWLPKFFWVLSLIMHKLGC